jgi:hypothetical protein
VLCCLFSLFTLLSWISGRPVLAFLCFWTAFKSKELAVCLPVALTVLEYWLRQTGRPISPWRLIPFYAVSLNFGLQALFGNAAQHEPYRLHVSFDALRTTLPVYAPWLLMAAPAIFLRDRRIWIVLALLATAITILLLPGRLFTVYLYLPLTGAAIAMAILFTRWRAVLTFVTITVWLLWSYSLLRPYRRLEIEHAHERRAYVTSLLSHPQLLASSHYFLYDGKPAHMDRGESKAPCVWPALPSALVCSRSK